MVLTKNFDGTINEHPQVVPAKDTRTGEVDTSSGWLSQQYRDASPMRTKNSNPIIQPYEPRVLHD